VPLKDLCQHIFHQITLISHEDYKRSQRLYYMSFIINSGPRKQFFRICLCVQYGVVTISRLFEITGLFSEYSLFYRALLQKRPIILRGLLFVATPNQNAEETKRLGCVSGLKAWLCVC
jgi:hypothetical protein